MIFDKHLNYDAQVSAFCKASFFHLRNISRIRKYLSTDSTKTLVHAFVTIKLDNCNSLLLGLPQKLTQRFQMVQNCAARLVFNKRKFENVTPLLIDMHFYLQNFGYYIQGAQCSRTGLYYPTRSLRSSNLMSLKVPPSNTVSYGDLAFSVAASKLWILFLMKSELLKT